MRRLLRFAWFINTTLVVLSALAIAGMIFGAAFVADLTVENRTAETVWITPIGAVGDEGVRVPLPIMLARIPLALPAFQHGDFRLLPGEVVTISYDFDDVNFSEVVIRDAQGRWTQVVADPHPTANRYHAPLQKPFVLSDFSQRHEPTKETREAVARALFQSSRSVVIYLVLIAPWVLQVVIDPAIRRWGRPPTQAASGPIDPCVAPSFRGE